MVTYLTIFQTNDENASRGLELIFSKLRKNTPSEPGCISYKIYTEVNNPLRSYILEIWMSQEQFEDHGEVAAANGYVKQALVFTTGPIETFQIIEK
ncbi:Quinol monooxygenase YgiN [Pedobacter westerhofensis]|uniref:Quinol monooxygenase YgiN n=1 Tax=Pedobacter westerhofensis TaxID=425512 RepID=A0A521CSQ7_9SPHI|nr:antibiotic biosynthesis monooxygenase [Pedobacter westerhofensis]SMO62418.1 Quinol monooxygenase YgiN [Pedobacter westerhofensis]